MNTLFRIKKQQFSPQFCAHLFPFNRTKIAWGCEQGEQGWRCGDCTRLPRTWPVFDLGLAVTSGLNWLLVFTLIRKVFLRAFQFSPLLQNQHFQIPIVLFNKPQSAKQSVQSAMLEGKLTITPALGHQNKGKSSFTG